MRELRHDLVLEVPGQDEDVVRTVLLERLGMPDRDVGSRQVLTLLIRIAVDRVVEEIGANTAEVQERVPLPRRAVAGDALAFAAAVDQELEQTPLRLVDLRREREVGLERVEAERNLACEEV